jgi:hypothetical protein
MEYLQPFILPALLFDASRHTPSNENPQLNLAEWMLRAPFHSSDALSSKRLNLYRHAITVGFLQFSHTPHVQDILSALHRVVVRNKWPFTLSPAWTYSTLPMAIMQPNVWHWFNQPQVLGHPPTIRPLPPALADFDLDIQLRSHNATVAAQKSEQSLTPDQRTRLYMSEKTPWQHAWQRATLLACMGILPRGIPQDVFEKRTLSTTRNFLQQFPHVYTLKMLSILIKLSLYHMFGVQSQKRIVFPPKVAGEEAHWKSLSELQETQLQQWVHFGQNTLRITKAEMQAHLKLVYDYLHLYEGRFNHSSASSEEDVWKDVPTHIFSDVWHDTDPVFSANIVYVKAAYNWQNRDVLASATQWFETCFRILWNKAHDAYPKS